MVTVDAGLKAFTRRMPAWPVVLSGAPVASLYAWSRGTSMAR